MWFFGGVITMGLLSFNLRTVAEGSMMLPYLMGGVGYTGLLLVTLGFVMRFLRSLEARGPVGAAQVPATVAAATA